MRVILKHAVVEYQDWGAVSFFPDGTTWGAHPHDSHHYAVVSHRCGYGDDLLAYAREHEVFHHLSGEAFYGGVSPVIWHLAHRLDVDPQSAALEECMTMALQRWVRANERPLIGGVDWDALRARALELLP